MTNTSADNLKPCPFCGSAAKLVVNPILNSDGEVTFPQEHYVFIQCSRCEVTSRSSADSYIPIENAKLNVIRYWNSRVS